MNIFHAFLFYMNIFYVFIIIKYFYLMNRNFVLNSTLGK